MKRVTSLPIRSLSGHERRLDVYVGDIAEPATPADLVCVSAFPGDYLALSHGVIGALHNRGIDVGALARAKAHDWRLTWQCWISHPLAESQHLPARRVLCFEHAGLPGGQHTGEQDAPMTVGNVFRAIHELVLSEAALADGEERTLECIRLPLLASGDQRVDRGAMLEAIIRQAYLSLVLGLPVQRVEIVLHPAAEDLFGLLVCAGRAIEEARAEWPGASADWSQEFDFFISYRTSDALRVDPVVEAMRTIKPDVRLFIDREQIAPGSFWKSDLLHGLVQSRHALCFITDNYADSPECMDEFHAAMCMQRRHGAGYLRPLLRLSALPLTRLPMSVQRVQCIDASGANASSLAIAHRALNG